MLPGMDYQVRDQTGLSVLAEVNLATAAIAERMEDTIDDVLDNVEKSVMNKVDENISQVTVHEIERIIGNNVGLLVQNDIDDAIIEITVRVIQRLYSMKWQNRT